MLASIATATLLGIDGHAVRVEVHLGGGLPGFGIVGLPDTAVRESRERVLQRGGERAVQRVHRLGTAEREPDDAVGDVVDFDEGRGHGPA